MHLDICMDYVCLLLSSLLNQKKVCLNSSFKLTLRLVLRREAHACERTRISGLSYITGVHQGLPKYIRGRWSCYASIDRMSYAPS